MAESYGAQSAEKADHDGHQDHVDLLGSAQAVVKILQQLDGLVDHPEEPDLLFKGNIPERAFESARGEAKFLLQSVRPTRILRRRGLSQLGPVPLRILAGEPQGRRSQSKGLYGTGGESEPGKQGVRA